MDASNVVVLSEIFPAGDAPIAGVSSEVLARKVADQGHADVRFMGGLDAIEEALPPELRPGDLVLTLGAGDIAQLGPRLLARLAELPARSGEVAP